MSAPAPQAAALLAFIVGALCGGEAEDAFRQHPARRQKLILKAAAVVRSRWGQKAAAHWLTLAQQMTDAIGIRPITGDAGLPVVPHHAE